MEGDHRWSCSSFDPNWEDRNDPFESALSSLVSSPAGSANGFVFRELIAKLGTISNNNNNTGEEMSPQSCQNPNLPGLGFLKSDPGFVSVPKSEMGDSREGSSVSEQNPGRELGGKPQLNLNSRKRKVIPKAKGAVKEKEDKVGRETDESSCAKRSKADEDDAKLAEPPKDYIHVRARRGQATDSHSVAERVRREKISERMKFLQDLVPGCNKVTGKAVVLDEIINYVQLLQRQVEFLSMKLATMNSRMDVNMEVILSKDILQLPSAMFQIDSSASGFPYGFLPQQMTMPPNGIHPENPTAFSLNPLDMAIHQNVAIQIPSTSSYGNSAPQMPSFWEDDLHSIMGFPQNMMQDSHGTTPTPQMKTEL